MDVMDGMEGGVSEKMLASLLELRMSSMSIKFDGKWNCTRSKKKGGGVLTSLLSCFVAQFWDNLSPESAFLARVYTNVLHSNKVS